MCFKFRSFCVIMRFVVSVTIFPFSHRSTVFLKMTQKVAFQTCLSNSRAFFFFCHLMYGHSCRSENIFHILVLSSVVYIFSFEMTASQSRLFPWLNQMLDSRLVLFFVLFVWSICFSTVSKVLAIDLILSKVPSSPRLNTFFSILKIGTFW